MGGDPQEALRRVLDGTEGQVAAGLEQLVAGEGFSKLLVQITENVVAVSRITGDVADLILRNLRLAGRHDVERLGRQLIRRRMRRSARRPAIWSGHTARPACIAIARVSAGTRSRCCWSSR